MRVRQSDGGSEIRRFAVPSSGASRHLLPEGEGKGLPPAEQRYLLRFVFEKVTAKHGVAGMATSNTARNASTSSRRGRSRAVSLRSKRQASSYARGNSAASRIDSAASRPPIAIAASTSLG